ncbi:MULTISPECIES: hypothetical protein [unclassified Frankia]|uniref:hypothetical protein n=1 Tax=unclassified Frankia TaxID=2632575 RepID=UPI001EE402A3|nr:MULTISPECIES: hypothetical protein [unclassified Frankia]
MDAQTAPRDGGSGEQNDQRSDERGALQVSSDDVAHLPVHTVMTPLLFRLTPVLPGPG